MANNVDITYKFLRRKGFTAQQAAGVIGAMQGESGKDLDTNARNPSSGAYGIAQWLGGRKSSLLSRKNPTNIHTQLNHLWNELQGPESAAFQRIKSAKTVDQATDAWVLGFERPGPNERTLPQRRQNARNVLKGSRGSDIGGSNSPVTSGGGAVASAASAGTTTTRTVDDPAAQRRVILANFLMKRKGPNNILFTSGVLNPNEKTTKTETVTTPGQPASSGSSGLTGPTEPVDTTGMPKGVANFEGKKVAAWIAPALQYARQQGWKGSVNSGFRSFADQTRIYNSGVRPAARPGHSNHEGADFPRGAIDVTDAPQLNQILSKSKYGRKLKWAGAKDPVHFSHPHNGSY